MPFTVMITKLNKEKPGKIVLPNNICHLSVDTRLRNAASKNLLLPVIFIRMDRHHHVVCLATGPQPLAKFCRVQSNVSSSNYQYVLLSLMSSRNFLRRTFKKIS